MFESAILKNKKVLITAGPTYEPIDPVRFIGNRSSGKMGIALAEAFAKAGSMVTLVKGPTSLNVKTTKANFITEYNVNTAAEMFDTCQKYFRDSDVIVFAAAVADYTPKNVSDSKIKKKEDLFQLELVKTKDIALELGKLKTANQVMVGFALETDNEQNNALEKLKKKNFDFIVLNSLRDEGAGFQHNTNKVTIIDKLGNSHTFALKLKEDVALDILSFVEKVIKEK